MTHYSTDGPPGRRATGLPALLPGWFLLAALSQLLYLAHWPLYLGGRWIPFLPSIAVALVRLGLYSGIGLGLLRHDRTAWAGGVLEIGRTVLLFLGAVALHGGSFTGALFPAWWAQGSLAAVLPLFFGMLVALEWGWRPGSGLEVNIMIAARLLLAASVLGALTLRRQYREFGVTDRDRWKALLGAGLPVVLFLSGVEAVAWLLAGHR